jgi:O-antigen/teichoic acid export membrane protein
VKGRLAANPETKPFAESAADGVALVQGGAVTALTQLVSLLRAVFTLLVAWILGAPALGVLAVAWSIADVLSKLGNLGLDTTVLTFIARRKELGDTSGAARVLRSSIAWGLIFSVTVASFGIVALQLWGRALGWPDEIVRASSVMVLALPGIALYRISNGASRGMWRMRHDLYSHGLTETLGTTALFVLALSLGAGGLAPIIATVLGTWLAGLVAWWLARGLFRDIAPAPAAEGFHKSLLAASVPVALNNLLIIVMLRINLLLLGFMVGSVPGFTLTTLGVYAAAFELSNCIRKLQQSFGPMFTPVMAAAIARDDVLRMRRTFGQLARWMLAAQLPLLALFTLSGGLILCIYGTDYRGGALWLALLGLANVLGTFSALSGATTVVVRPSSNLFTSLLALPPQLILTLLLVRWAGPTGAALAAVASYLLQSGIRYWEIKRIFHWSWPWRDFMKPCAACLLALLPPAVLRLLWGGLVAELVAGLVFLGLYFLAWARLGMEPADRAVLNELLDRRRRGGREAAAR